MKPREELDAELDHLGEELHHWLCRIRHEAQFWPQLTALAEDILEEAETWDRLHVLYRIEVMLELHGKDPAQRPRCFDAFKRRRCPHGGAVHPDCGTAGGRAPVRRE